MTNPSTDTTTLTTDPTTDGGPDHLIEMPDGRMVAVDDRGRPDGPVVLLMHSAPGSRRLDPDPAATAAAGIRLVTLDRPGYGASTAMAPGVVPSVPGFADDAAVVLAALGITDVAVAGWSAGGRVALALAARHPHLVRAIALVGTPAPDDEVPWVPEEHREMIAMLRAEPEEAADRLAGIFAGIEEFDPTAPEALSGGAGDEAVLADPSRRGAIVEMLREGGRSGPQGVAADIVADQVAPWGFDLAAVGAPVALFYGDDDQVAVPAHGHWYADHLAEAELHVVPGAGHLLALTSWGAILKSLAAE